MLNRLLARAGYVKAPMPSGVGLADPGARWTMPNYTLAEKQAELYQRLSWVYIAVRAVAQAAAGVALNIKQRSGIDLKDIDNHPFELLLERPNPLQSRFEFLEATIGYRLLTGNAYWWLNRRSASAEPAELWLIPPYRIQPVPDGNLGVKGYLYDDGQGHEVPIEAWEIAHFKTFHPLHRYVGMSAIEALATTAIGDMKMAEWNTRYFAKDNAKPAGALAFADPIPDPDWERMKAQITKEHGGTDRRMMLLRNVGKGGVEYIPMGVTQKDMEFLAGRTFNKEEIFSALAPGLSSMLAVNATEANALAGKSTFMEMAVWPQLTAVAEKLTNDLLPAYGPNLIAQFDEVRLSDRAMELKEIEAFARVHTINEIREKFYQDDPLEDERGDLLPAQIAAGSSVPGDEPDEPVMPDAQDEQAANADAETVETEDPSDDAGVKAELKRWERMATRRVKEGKPEKALSFDSDALPVMVKAYVQGALEAATSVDDVRLVFHAAEHWQSYP